MQEKEFVTRVIDLNSPDKLNESFLVMFGEFIKDILKSMFGSGNALPIKVKGTPAQIDAFSKALAGEKKYMDSFYKYGLHTPETYRTKEKLDRAISQFEFATRIKWPFK